MASRLQSESSSRQPAAKKTLGPSGARAQLGSSAALPSWMTAWMLSTIKTVMQLRKQRFNIARLRQIVIDQDQAVLKKELGEPGLHGRLAVEPREAAFRYKDNLARGRAMRRPGARRS